MNSREWALRAALHDSSSLITPKARERALDALSGQRDPIAWAARRLLLDGGAQQGGEMLHNFSLAEYSLCVKRLTNWERTITWQNT